MLKKQNVKNNEQWLKAYEDSISFYSYEDILDLERKTIQKIEKVCLPYKNICSGWIAGKDSIVLENLLRKANIKYRPIMWRGINEYPMMKKWINENKPKDLIEEIIDKYSLEFLEKHPDYLFCKNKTRQNWMSTKWTRQRADIKKYKFDLFITGRRIKDGNQCGTKENNFVVNKGEYDVYSPIADWEPEQLLAYIRYNHLDLPPFYKWNRGFLIGSIAMGEWTERAILDKTEDEVWEELFEIDKSIVIEASKKLSSAKRFMERKMK